MAQISTGRKLELGGSVSSRAGERDASRNAARGSGDPRRALARGYSHVRHVSASRAAGSTRDALASRDRRDSRFGKASVHEARNHERARTDPCVAPVKRFRTLTDGSSNRRGRRRAHARARPGPADSRVLLARDRSTARSRAERATSASPRSPSRSARARAAFPRRDIVVVAPHRARVATREDAWHARARPWTPP